MNRNQRSTREGFPSFMRKWASGRKALFTLALWLLSAIGLQIIDRRLALLSAGETKLDLRFGYDYQTVQALFDSYGSAGRNLYLGNLALDTLMPLFLAVATALFITLALRRASLALLAVTIPISFFLMDVVENVLLVTLVTSYPDIDPNWVLLASAITRPKLIAAMVTYGILILSALILAGRYAGNMLSNSRVSGQSQ